VANERGFRLRIAATSEGGPPRLIYMHAHTQVHGNEDHFLGELRLQ
jgi:hypothetical protein